MCSPELIDVTTQVSLPNISDAHRLEDGINLKSQVPNDNTDLTSLPANGYSACMHALGFSVSKEPSDTTTQTITHLQNNKQRENGHQESKIKIETPPQPNACTRTDGELSLIHI